MKTGHAVVGANYGDEGKGLMTDYLASESPKDTLVVRYNGGAQAGHTVVAPDGRRHVFSHFGAGTFVECPSHLSQFFIVNPMLFSKELKELNNLGLHPTVSIDYRAFVTTPFDMLVNQKIENRRGNARFGSCGVGINETVTRSLRSPDYLVRAGDLTNTVKLKEKLMIIAQHWLPERWREYKYNIGTDEIAEILRSAEALADRFCLDAKAMLETAVITYEYPRNKHIIFEGAQGLMLDESRIDQWPHLTRSNTGLTNVMFLASRYGIEELNVTYMTRTYLTRHGAGPLDGECGLVFRDETNVPNEYQGRLRFAPLDTRQINESVAIDLSQAKRMFPTISANMGITCADQLALGRDAKFPVPIAYTSYGSTRRDVLDSKVVRHICAVA